MSDRRGKNGAAGYTLAEMMMILAVLGMTMAIAAPAWNTYRRNMDIRGTAFTAKTAVHQARLLSVFRNRTHFVVVTPSTRQMQVYEDSSAPQGVYDAGDTLVSTMQWAEGIQIGLPTAPTPITNPITGTALAAGWTMPDPAAGGAWTGEQVGVMTLSNGSILSVDASPASVSNGAVVFNNNPGGAGSVSISIEGNTGTVRAYRHDGTTWQDL